MKKLQVRKRCIRNGFSLLELSVVLLVIGLIISTIVPAITQGQLKQMDSELQFRFEQIENATLRFIQVNNRLPCPAIRGTTIFSPTYGYEAATPGTCTSTYAPASNVVLGVVPTKTLGIPDEYGFDPWGRAITYVVDLRATGVAALTSSYGIDSTALNAITVNDYDYATTTTTARNPTGVMLLISHGPNGHGGYLPNGTRFSNGVTNTFELKNCQCQSTASSNAAAPDNVFYAIIPAVNTSSLLNSSDDRVKYYTRGMLASPRHQALPY